MNAHLYRCPNQHQIGLVTKRETVICSSCGQPATYVGPTNLTWFQPRKDFK